MARRKGPESGAQARSLLLALVARRPGIHKAEAARALNLSWTTVQHHVRILCEESRIREFALSKNRVLVPTSLPPSQVASCVALASNEAQAVFRLLAFGGPRKVPELADRLSWSRKKLRRHLYPIVAAGLADPSTEYRPFYELTVAGRREAERRFGDLPAGSARVRRGKRLKNDEQ